MVVVSAATQWFSFVKLATSLLACELGEVYSFFDRFPGGSLKCNIYRTYTVTVNAKKVFSSTLIERGVHSIRKLLFRKGTIQYSKEEM